MKRLKKLMLMLLLITVGAQSAWADDITYADVNGVRYALYPDFYGGDYAYMVNIVGTNEAKTIVVPARINSNGQTYTVLGVREPNPGISNIAASTMSDLSGKVETLIFEGSIQIPATGYTWPAFSCQSLKGIYFLKSTPSFDQVTYGNYFNPNMTPANTITLYVVDKTAAQIATLKTQDVYKDFKDIVASDGLNPVQPVNAITFKDDAVKAICVNPETGWDTNGDGELSYDEAAAVTSLGEAFRDTYSHPVEIETFDELQYFTGLTTIDEYAFQSSGLTSVILPNSVQSIGKSAFASCNLTRIQLSENITSIGESAFTLNRSLVSIELPQSLETIGSFAFNETGLRTIYIPAGVTSIGSRQFGNCKDLASIIVDKNNAVYDSRNDCNAIIVKATNTLQEGCRSTVIPDDVVAIGSSAFRNRGIPSLVIPESVTSIGNYAFMGVNQVYGSATYYMKRLELKWETPLEARQNMFGIEGVDYPKQCTLVVPAGKIDDYIGAGWTTTYFKEIVEAPTEKSRWTVYLHDAIEGVQRYVTFDENGAHGVDNISDYFDIYISKANADISQLKVPVTGRPVRVVRNGVDITYQSNNYADGYLYYDMDVRRDADWEISYETSHRQTFIRKGGTENGVEVGYDFPVDGYERYYYPDNVGTPLYVDFPIYNNPNAHNAYIYVDVKDNMTLKVLRNGEIINVDNIFKTTNGAAAGFTRRMLTESDYADDNGSTLESLGFELRDPAVWEITIEESHKMLNAYANNDVSVAIAKVVEGEEPNYVARENSLHQWVNVGETYVVKFTPMHEEELTRFDIGWNAIDIANESRLVRNDDGSYSFTITYDEMNEERFDIMAVFSGGTNDENAVEYMFIGDFVRVDVSADYNGNVPYDGYMFTKDNVEGFYIDRVIENGTAVNQEASIEFQLPNENATCRVFRNGVDMTTSFSKGVEGWYNLIGNDAWMHEPAQWVIINESDLMKYDVNRDEKIDVIDVTTLVNKILHK